MGYYVRVLGTSNPDIHIDTIVESLKKQNLAASIELDESENEDNWTVIRVFNSDGEDIMQIEKNVVVEGELGKDELDEFREIILDCKPSSAVKWLTKYFDKVRVIYAFQLLNSAFEDVNFDIVTNIKSCIWTNTDGILQADNEGFTNEDGYHILWQFADDVTGEYNMAVKNFFGNWTNFTMDLGDTKQREEFFKGNVPKSAKKI